MLQFSQKCQLAQRKDFYSLKMVAGVESFYTTTNVTGFQGPKKVVSTLGRCFQILHIHGTNNSRQ